MSPRAPAALTEELRLQYLRAESIVEEGGAWAARGVRHMVEPAWRADAGRRLRLDALSHCRERLERAGYEVTLDEESIVVRPSRGPRAG